MQYKSIPELLRDARLNKGLTQAEVGEFVGISPDAISKIENGKNGLSLNYVPEICKILSIEPNIFLRSVFMQDFDDDIIDETFVDASTVDKDVVNENFVRCFGGQQVDVSSKEFIVSVCFDAYHAGKSLYLPAGKVYSSFGVVDKSATRGMINTNPAVCFDTKNEPMSVIYVNIGQAARRCYDYLKAFRSPSLLHNVFSQCVLHDSVKSLVRNDVLDLMDSYVFDSNDVYHFYAICFCSCLCLRDVLGINDKQYISGFSKSEVDMYVSNGNLGLGRRYDDWTSLMTFPIPRVYKDTNIFQKWRDTENGRYYSDVLYPVLYDYAPRINMFAEKLCNQALDIITHL